MLIPSRYSSAALCLASACAAPAAWARTVPVQDSAGLIRAMTSAQPGDEIVLSNGSYALTGKVAAKTPGTASAPITVRAANRLGAHILSTGVIAFEVTAPYWHFAGLDIRGRCETDTGCEHAFHVVGRASFFQLTGSRLADFNAHLKVNSNPAHDLPANGLVENNEFFDSHARRTDNPVAPVNIDNAVNWIVRGNFIHDFQKDGTGEGSYGAFVKGGSQSPVLERNLVICARNAPAMGEMVGLSFGAHGMDPDLCPPHWNANQACDPEVNHGIMRNNIVLNCNADGIYLNKARASRILFNTVLQTGGIEFRYAGSTGIARGNLLTGRIEAAQGGQVTATGNVSASAATAQNMAAPGGPAGLGANPHRAALDAPEREVPEDYCGRARGSRPEIGAVQNSLGPCPLWH